MLLIGGDFTTQFKLQIEGQDVLLEHPLEEPDYGGAVVQDEPPLLRDAARAGRDLEVGVAAVLGSAEHHAELERVDALGGGGDERLHVFEDRLLSFLLTHLGEDLRLFVRVLDDLDRLDDRLRALQLPDELLALLLVVPEVGLALSLFDLLQACAGARVVKAPPSAAAADWRVLRAGR